MTQTDLRQPGQLNEEAYLERFTSQLEKATTVADAYSVALTAMPLPETVGRLQHTSLLDFLSSLLATQGTPPYCFNRTYPIVPVRATLAERSAYRGLVRRLLLSEEIDQTDAQYVDQLLNKPPLVPLDSV